MPPASPVTSDDVVAVGGVDDDVVGRTVAAVPPIVREVEVDLGRRRCRDRSLTVMLSAPPRALKSIVLDVVEVHRDVGDVAGEADPPAVGRDVDVLGDVGAVEQHRVEAGLALEGVVVVAGVPDEGVVAGAHQGRVVAVAAVDQVVALAADEQVGAEAAVHRELDAVGLAASWR